jgi:hypothetical protein
MASEANRARIWIDIGMVDDRMEFAIHGVSNVLDTKILRVHTARVQAVGTYPEIRMPAHEKRIGRS